MKKRNPMQWRSSLMAIGFAIGMVFGATAYPDEGAVLSPAEKIQKRAEDFLVAKTLGTRQLWADVSYFARWRIQQNVYTKSCRLVDPQRVHRVTGTLEDCQNAFNSIRNDLKLTPETGSAVILIHGLLQTSHCMKEMANTLRQAGYVPIEFDYPSTQVSIPEAARFLEKLIASLEGFQEINFVVHSMGGLVVRAYAMNFGDPRIKRMVMLGTPNRGAELADITQQVWIIRTASGPGARQLGTRSDGLVQKLPAPNFEFAVIAGSRGTPSGWNPLIPGDDDGTVTVESTRLPGAADFNTVRAVHSNLLWDAEAIAQTVSFLKLGRLRADSDPQPIPLEDPLPTAKVDTRPKADRK